MTAYFKDRIDPADNNFRLVEIRLPRDPRVTSYGPFEYHDAAAGERLRRFCAAYLAGVGDITMRDAEKICRKSDAVDARRKDPS